MTTLYLSGKMTGLPSYGYPIFAEHAARLRQAGYTVVSPHEMDRVLFPEFNPDTDEFTDEMRTQALAADFQAITKCDGLALIHGWQKSDGATKERAVALWLGKTVARVEDWLETAASHATDWAAERNDILNRFTGMLAKVTGDGSVKRQRGEKPPWYEDHSHQGAIFSHLTNYFRGELVDPDSGAHPLVHAAWRCLAIAAQDTNNIPQLQHVGPSEFDPSLTGDKWQ